MIPKKIKIRGFWWNIIVVDPRECKWLDYENEVTMTLGTCVQAERIIYINKLAKHHDEVFLHEWGHAVLYEVGLQEISPAIEEVITENFAKEIKLNGWFKED